MADYKVTDTELISVANKIRTKGGTQAQLEWPTDYISAIDAIPASAASDPYYLLNPTEMDYIASNSPQIQSTMNYNAVQRNALSTMFAKIVCKFNWNSSYQENFWLSMKYTYNSVSDTAFLGRYGNNSCGMFFTTKIPGGAYNELHLRYEITSGAYSGAYLKIYLQSGLGFNSNGIDPDSSKTLYTEQIADALTADNEKIIDISNISNDFYVAFLDYNGFVKFRGLWFEI